MRHWYRLWLWLWWLLGILGTLWIMMMMMTMMMASTFIVNNWNGKSSDQIVYIKHFQVRPLPQNVWSIRLFQCAVGDTCYIFKFFVLLYPVSQFSKYERVPTIIWRCSLLWYWFIMSSVNFRKTKKEKDYTSSIWRWCWMAPMEVQKKGWRFHER